MSENRFSGSSGSNPLSSSSPISPGSSGQNSGSASGGRPSSMFSLLGVAGTMGMHMVSGPLAGGGLGWLVDRWLDVWPWGAGIGVLLGVLAGFRNVWADARHLLREQERLDQEKKARNGQQEGDHVDR